MKINDLSTNHNAWLNETTLGRQLSEAPKGMVNFGAEDLKNLEQIRDLPTLKAQALSLISKPSAKPMKPEKVEWFKNALETMNSPMKVIKLMYDLLLSGEGNSVVGSRNSMSPNSYRQRFGEEGIAEGQDKFVVWYMIDDGNWDEHGTFNNEAEASAYIEQLAAKGYDDDNFEVLTPGQHPDDNHAYTKDMGEAGTLDKYRDRLGTTGNLQRQNDRHQEYQDAAHTTRLNYERNRQRRDDAQIQADIDRMANRNNGDHNSLSKWERDDWDKTFDMMRDRLNRYQWSSQRDVDPEQLAAISNIKYEPRKKNESSPAGMQQSWTNSSDAVHTPGKPMPQSLRKKMNPEKPSGVQAKTDDELLAYYAQRKAEKQQGVKEGMDDSPVAGAITRRILMQRTDLLAKYGPVKVMNAIDEVADFVGDVEEIGSSDVSGWIKHVEQMLGNMTETNEFRDEYNSFKGQP